MLIDLLWRYCGLLEETLGWDSIGYSWWHLSFLNSSDLLEVSEEAPWRLAFLRILCPALFAMSKRKVLRTLPNFPWPSPQAWVYCIFITYPFTKELNAPPGAELGPWVRWWSVNRTHTSPTITWLGLWSFFLSQSWREKDCGPIRHPPSQ